MSGYDDRPGGGLPPRLRGGLERYRDRGIRPGGYLQAVLRNDLAGALGRADPESWDSLAAIMRWITEDMPHDAWGSRDAVESWIRDGGMTGRHGKAWTEHDR